MHPAASTCLVLLGPCLDGRSLGQEGWVSVYGEGSWTSGSLNGLRYLRLPSILSSAWAPPHPTSSEALIELPLPAKEGRCPVTYTRLQQDYYNGDHWKGTGAWAHRAPWRPERRPWAGAESQPPDSPQCPGIGAELGASHLLLQGRIVSLAGCAMVSTPASASHPPHPTPPAAAAPHTQKIGYILNKAIRFLIRGLGCSV